MMLLAAEAWQLREAARRSIKAHDFHRAHELALMAQKVRFTPGGESLRLLSAWLFSLGADERTQTSTRLPELN